VTAAAPLPQPEIPATAAMLGHVIRYPVTIKYALEYRAACHCHYWDLLDTAEAMLALGRKW